MRGVFGPNEALQTLQSLFIPRESRFSPPGIGHRKATKQVKKLGALLGRDDLFRNFPEHRLTSHNPLR